MPVVTPYAAMSGAVMSSIVDVPTLMTASADPQSSLEIDSSVPLPAGWSERIATARTAQAVWAERSVSQRVAAVRKFAALVAHRAAHLAEQVSLPQRKREETYVSELMPLADAARYLVRRGPRLLRPRWESRTGRPIWARGVAVQTRRQPWGVVLIVGPSNYPYLLPGVQMLQALTAGNAVFVKPGQGSTECAQALRMLWIEAGGDAGLVHVLPEETDAVGGALEAGVDHVVLTGSTASGRAVLRLAAETITPATMELSGCDALCVLESADVELAARAVQFGLEFNGSATCMAPRRVFVQRSRAADLLSVLERLSSDWQPRPVASRSSEQARELIAAAVQEGARIAVGRVPADDEWSPVVLSDVVPTHAIARSDLFAPVTAVITYDDVAELPDLIAKCPYALSATVFGEPRLAAETARRIPAGTILVNDLIAPTADPRVSFPAWNASGFGVTRGPEGLLQMTRPQVIVEQRGRWRPHLDRSPVPVGLFQGLMNLLHGCQFRQRWQGLQQMWRAVRESRRHRDS